MMDWFWDRLYGINTFDDERVRFFDCMCVAETKKALKIKLSDDTKYWFPKSHIRRSSEIKKLGDTGHFTISRWVVVKKGLWKVGGFFEDKNLTNAKAKLLLPKEK